MPRTKLVSLLKKAGFDRSRAIPFQRGARISCSQCEALVINGIPTHEMGCPNRPRKSEGRYKEEDDEV